MGQVLKRVQELELESGRVNRHDGITQQFPDLSQLPPEISLLVLSHLNATDLCLAACVWHDLGNDEILWHSLCHNQWRSVSIYSRPQSSEFSYKKLYLQLDEATLTFNADPKLGLEYLLKCNLVDDCPEEIAKYLHTCRKLDLQKKREFLAERQDVLDEIVKLQNFGNQFLPNALRQFFRETIPPNERNEFLSNLVKKFSERFCDCNPQLNLSQDVTKYNKSCVYHVTPWRRDTKLIYVCSSKSEKKWLFTLPKTVYIVCFSLILLSVDLTSPHIKNKMSKREFIRNTRRAAIGITDEFTGHLYDNVYLVGHVAPKA